MTMAELGHRIIDGWTIDRKVSIPVIVAMLTAIISAAFWLSDIKHDVQTNAKELVAQRHQFEEHKAFTSSIPLISERVGRLEATVTASTLRQEQGLEEIKALIVKSVRPQIRRQ